MSANENENNDNNNEEIIQYPAGSEPLIKDNRRCTNKQIIIFSIIILLILFIIFLILFLALYSKGEVPYTPNYIKGIYYIEYSANEIKIFHSSYLNLIKAIKIDGKSVKINNTQIFENEGNITIEIHFKKN